MADRKKKPTTVRVLSQTLTALIVVAIGGVAIIAGEASLPVTAAEAPVAAAPEPEPAPLPAISVAPATRDEIVDMLRVTGSIVAREEVVVGVDVEGLKVVEILADVGDRVAAGDVLARLSTDTIDVQLAQNASSLARADAAIAQVGSQIAEAEAANTVAAAALQRASELFDRGVIANDVLEQRQSDADTAAARLEAARRGLDVAVADRRVVEAQRAEIELRLEKAEVRAPASGVVLGRTARVGAIASGGAEPLFRIAEDGLVELAADATETDLVRLAAGMPVSVTPSGGGEALSGEVRLVSPEVDPATRLGSVRIALQDAESARIGSFAWGDIEVARRTGITVPLGAVLETRGTASVQVVADGVVETRPVETGLRDVDKVEVVSGLEEGESVVSRAGTFVQDGDHVVAVEPQS